jgi:hypothetical protein
MAQYQVTCIARPHAQSSHEDITHIGNPGIGNPGYPWKLPVAQVIKRIESNTDSFYVLNPRTLLISNVGVVRIAAGRAYLRTHANGEWTDNLLSLNDCPSDLPVTRQA